MTPRDTSTGRMLEQMIIPALERGGYSYEEQVEVGERLGGGRHNVDVVASDGVEDFLISAKWQQVSGTAEQKVPFEVMCLAHAIRYSNGRFTKAYLVLGGSGWRLRDCYTRGELDDYLRRCDCVHIMALEDFVAKANSGELS